MAAAIKETADVFPTAHRAFARTVSCRTYLRLQVPVGAAVQRFTVAFNSAGLGGPAGQGSQIACRRLCARQTTMRTPS
jgi:hypothetical protein